MSIHAKSRFLSHKMAATPDSLMPISALFRLAMLEVLVDAGWRLCETSHSSGQSTIRLVLPPEVQAWSGPPDAAGAHGMSTAAHSGGRPHLK